MTTRKNIRSYPPPKGTTESFEMVDAGMPLNPEQIKALYDAQGLPHPDRPLVPTAEEVSKLTTLGQVAFVTRCGLRVAPLRNGDATPTAAVAAANLIVAAADYRTPIRKQLRAVRRDFDRLKRFVRRYNLADDTPVPPDVFGAMWPDGQTPAWALPK